MKKDIAVLALSALLCTGALAADPVLPPNAAQDAPVRDDAGKKLEKAMEPYIAQAKKTYPQAKRRFLKGLPKGQSFFITTRLSDSKDHVEQVFVAVDAIQGNVVSGKIWSDIQLVENFKRGDSYSFPERAMVDWLIAKPDGSEEGNVVGKFLDSYAAKQPAQ